MSFYFHISVFAFAILLFCSCKPARTKPEERDIKQSDSTRMNVSQSDANYIEPKAPGTYITTIEFGIKATPEEWETFEDGVLPWISLDTPEINRLIDADVVVLPYKDVVVMIDYPVANPVYFSLRSETNGFSRRDLVTFISRQYHMLYEEEERTATTKTIPMEERKNLANRNETNGKYGIWGHDLADLDLSDIQVYKSDAGSIYLMLGVES